MALIVVPGEYVDAQRRECTTRWEEHCRAFYWATYEQHRAADRNGDPPHVTVRVIEHGWPRPYLARALVWRITPSGVANRVASTPLIRFASKYRSWGGPLFFVVSWSSYDNWPCSADDWMVHYWHLAFDMFAALLIMGAVGGAVEWWVRRRGGLFRYRIVDMLAAVTVCGVLLGWHEHHKRIQRMETQHATTLVAPSFRSHGGEMTSGRRYCGPDWLRRLAGNAHLLPRLHHVYTVSVKPGEHWQPIFEQLPKLPYLESVTIRERLPLDAIDTLERCPRLTTLTLPTLDSHSVRVMSDAGERLLGVWDLAELQRLNLTKLELSGEAVLAEDIEQVAAFPTVRSLSLWGVSATPQEIDAIRQRHPDVQIIAAWQHSETLLVSRLVPPPGHDTMVEAAKLSRQRARE